MNFESIQWLENYQSPGEVKVVLQKTDEAMELLQEGYRIYNTDSDTIAKICEIIVDDTEEITRLTVRAQTTAQILSDRIVMGTIKGGNIELGMIKAFSENLRGLSMNVAPLKKFPETTEIEISWCTVLELEEKLAKQGNLGFKVVFYPSIKKEIFTVYRGVDRTKPENYIGAFSTKYGNLIGVELQEGTSDFKNCAIILGGGEEGDRIIAFAFTEYKSGEERRELFVDAKDLQRKYTVEVNTGTVDENGNPKMSREEREYTEEEYQKMLENKGLEKLAEQVKVFDISLDVAQTNIKFGVDYFLGDRMPVYAFGLNGSAIVSSVNKIYENKQDRVVLTLSEFRKEQ